MNFYFTTLISLSLKLLCRLRILRNKQLLFVTRYLVTNEITRARRKQKLHFCVCVCVCISPTIKLTSPESMIA